MGALTAAVLALILAVWVLWPLFSAVPEDSGD